MRTIHKYEVPIADSFTLELPANAHLLCVQTQLGTPQLWALVDADARKEAHRFELRGTGHNCDGLSPGEYVGTFQIRGGDLVFHLFHLGAA